MLWSALIFAPHSRMSMRQDTADCLAERGSGIDANPGGRGAAYYPTSSQCSAEGENHRFSIGQSGGHGTPTRHARLDQRCSMSINRSCGVWRRGRDYSWLRSSPLRGRRRFSATFCVTATPLLVEPSMFIVFAIAYRGTVSRSCLSARGILLRLEIILHRDEELFRTFACPPFRNRFPHTLNVTPAVISGDPHPRAAKPSNYS